jgi:hypothetical protein
MTICEDAATKLSRKLYLESARIEAFAWLSFAPIRNIIISVLSSMKSHFLIPFHTRISIDEMALRLPKFCLTFYLQASSVLPAYRFSMPYQTWKWHRGKGRGFSQLLIQAQQRRVPWISCPNETSEACALQDADAPLHYVDWEQWPKQKKGFQCVTNFGYWC